MTDCDGGRFGLNAMLRDAGNGVVRGIYKIEFRAKPDKLVPTR